MIGFKDKTGRFWQLELTIGLIESIKEKALTDIDTLITAPEEFGKVLLMNPRKFAEILWVMCEEQAVVANVSPTDFGKLLNRDTIDKASNAFIESILDFYPRQSAGRVMRENLPALLMKMDSEIEKTVRTHMLKVSSGTDMN